MSTEANFLLVFRLPIELVHGFLEFLQVLLVGTLLEFNHEALNELDVVGQLYLVHLILVQVVLAVIKIKLDTQRRAALVLVPRVREVAPAVLVKAQVIDDLVVATDLLGRQAAKLLVDLFNRTQLS